MEGQCVKTNKQVYNAGLGRGVILTSKLNCFWKWVHVKKHRNNLLNFINVASSVKPGTANEEELSGPFVHITPLIKHDNIPKYVKPRQ